MYHYNILTQEDNETIKKMYEKQKKNPTKGDWFQLLKEDFKFIEEDMDEEKIKTMSKQF